MSAVVSPITGVSILCSTVCSGADQRKHQSSAPLAFVRGIHRSPVDSPHKGPVTLIRFPFDDVIMLFQYSMSQLLITIGNCTISCTTSYNSITTPTAAFLSGSRNIQVQDECKLLVPFHDDDITWKRSPHYWPFVRGINCSPVDFPSKGPLTWKFCFLLTWSLLVKGQ